MILKKGSSTCDVEAISKTCLMTNKDARDILLDNGIRNMVLCDITITKYCHVIKTTSELLANIDTMIAEKDISYPYDKWSIKKVCNIDRIIHHKDPFPIFYKFILCFSLNRNAYLIPTKFLQLISITIVEQAWSLI